MTHQGARATTLNDVALEAGVSHQTVSRVVNAHPSVRPETRRRVLEAIERLGYAPNGAARSLAGGRSAVLGLLSYGTHQFGPAQMTGSLERAARERGYALSLAHLGDVSAAQLEGAVQALRRQRVGGLLMVAPVVGLEQGRLERLCAGLPTVLLESPPHGALASAAIDQLEGARLAARHLLGLGHRRFALLGGPQDWAMSQVRARGWLEALGEAGLRPVARLEGDWSARSGHAAVRGLLAGGPPFTALLAANDQMALGALRALHGAGLSVPGDVSVAGFDDLPEAEFFEPPLTTVRQDFAALGRRGLEQLLALIETPDAAPRSVVIPARLVVRESTGGVGVRGTS